MPSSLLSTEGGFVMPLAGGIYGFQTWFTWQLTQDLPNPLITQPNQAKATNTQTPPSPHPKSKQPKKQVYHLGITSNTTITSAFSFSNCLLLQIQGFQAQGTWCRKSQRPRICMEHAWDKLSSWQRTSFEFAPTPPPKKKKKLFEMGEWQINKSIIFVEQLSCMTNVIRLNPQKGSSLGTIRVKVQKCIVSSCQEWHLNTKFIHILRKSVFQNARFAWETKNIKKTVLWLSSPLWYIAGPQGPPRSFSKLRDVTHILYHWPGVDWPVPSQGNGQFSPESVCFPVFNLWF